MASLEISRVGRWMTFLNRLVEELSLTQPIASGFLHIGFEPGGSSGHSSIGGIVDNKRWKCSGDFDFT